MTPDEITTVTALLREHPTPELLRLADWLETMKLVEIPSYCAITEAGEKIDWAGYPEVLATQLSNRPDGAEPCRVRRDVLIMWRAAHYIRGDDPWKDTE